MTSRKSYQCLGGCNVLIGEWSTPDREWRDLTRFIKFVKIIDVICKKKKCKMYDMFKN